MKNLIVGQSGGPTAVINSSLYGVIREGFNRSEEIEHVYGMINGIQGFLDGRFMDMKELDNDTLEALRKEYAKNFGPLTATQSKAEKTWNWVETPWPWEMED